MKKQYDFYVNGINDPANGIHIDPQPEKAKEILAIPRYADFDKKEIVETPTVTKKVKRRR